MLESPAGTSYGPVSLSLSSGTSSTNWMGQFSLPAGCELGTWKVSRVYLTDSAGNARNYYYGNGISAAVVFSVIAGSNDTLETGDAPNTNDNGANPALDCTSIVYSAWSSCQNGSQSRTIGSSFPAGCSATNAVLTQACTVSSACTYFTYSDWSACSSTGQQTRTILSKYPSGCTGGQYESLSRTCNTAGTSTSTVSLACTFTYSDWSACSSTGYQTRTITSKYPLGCTSGQSESLNRYCADTSTTTTATTTCAKDEWSCENWGTCVGGIQRRACKMVFDCLGVESEKPKVETTCISTVPSTSTAASSHCQYKFSDYGPCENGKQRREILSRLPSGCVENLKEPLERICGTSVSTSSSPSLSECGPNDWKCGEWTECNSDGKQTRVCSFPSTCAVPSGTQKPEISRGCGDGANVAGKPVAATGGAGQTWAQSCSQTGSGSREDCELYSYRTKIVKECLANNLKTQDECRQYFLDKYGKPLKCLGMEDQKCYSLINDLILSDLKVAITPENKEILSGLSGRTAVVSAGSGTITVDPAAGAAGGGKEVKMENMPLARSGSAEKFSVSLLSMAVSTSSQQQILSPVAIVFDSDKNGIADDVEKRLGTSFRDRSAVTQDQIESLSGVDQALIAGKSLEQPKLSDIDPSESLTVGSVETVEPAGDVVGSALRLQGKAQPDQVVTLFIYSTIPIVLTVKTDAYGNWIYDLDKDLADGQHEVYAVINDKEGRIVESSAAAPFFIQEAKAVTVDDFMKSAQISATAEGPENIINFYLIGGGAFILIAVGGFLLLRKKLTAAE